MSYSDFLPRKQPTPEEWLAWGRERTRELREAEAEAARLRAALTVYADRDNWAHKEDWECDEEAVIDWIGPRWPPWSIAQEALEPEKVEGERDG